MIRIYAVTVSKSLRNFFVENENHFSYRVRTYIRIIRTECARNLPSVIVKTLSRYISSPSLSVACTDQNSYAFRRNVAIVNNVPTLNFVVKLPRKKKKKLSIICGGEAKKQRNRSKIYYGVYAFNVWNVQREYRIWFTAKYSER